MSPVRVVYHALGLVELAVDVYGWVRRPVTRREKAFPLKPKPKPSPAPRR